MTKESLFDHVPLPARNIHGIPTELPVAQAAQGYEQTSGEFYDLRSVPLDETKRLVVANQVRQLDTWRITLTFPVINNAAHVAFLVSGTSKAARLKLVFEGLPQTHNLPSQGVQPVNGDLLWLVDQDAASQLAEGT